jgi:hypothetical protein
MLVDFLDTQVTEEVAQEFLRFHFNLQAARRAHGSVTVAQVLEPLGEQARGVARAYGDLVTNVGFLIDRQDRVASLERYRPQMQSAYDATDKPNFQFFRTVVEAGAVEHEIAGDAFRQTMEQMSLLESRIVERSGKRFNRVLMHTVEDAAAWAALLVHQDMLFGPDSPFLTGGGRLPDERSDLLFGFAEASNRELMRELAAAGESLA